jgi:histidyl-tRNA synthetase
MIDTLKKFQAIEKLFRDALNANNFTEIRTSTVQPLNLYTSAGTLTPSMLHGTYSFLDWDGWSGERIVLRPDVTVPAAQWYLNNMEGKEAKLFYIEPVYRFIDDKNNREIWQCGTEMIGISPETANAEIIKLVTELLGKLNLTTAIKVLITNKDDNLQTDNYETLPDGSIAKRLIKALGNIFDKTGFSYEFIDASQNKKFEYYTNYAFSVIANDTEILSGGRYDNLCEELGGKNTYASGFAFNMNEIIKLISDEQ